MLYLRQIQEGIDFIEAHLESDIELAEVARTAGMSQWHFQRIFKALTNETLKTYIRSRRFSRALEQLTNTRLSVLDIALASGYETQESFTRAFRDCFRLTPSQYRKMGNRSLFVRKIRFDQSYLAHLHHNISLTPDIKEQPPMQLVGLPTDYYGIDSEKNNLGQKLPPLWAAFLPRLGEIANTVPGVCYGIVAPERPHTEKLRYLACIEVQGLGVLPPGMAATEIPASTYARFTHRGPAQNVDATVNYIYSSWMLSAEHQHTLGPDLEIYGSAYHPTLHDSVMHYAIPVTPPPG
ncbi:AraC family transcriptional regulator [Acidovorax sp. D2M1]|uniref:AraC family transcriptional regulator n=1 Tax=Acidovorax benzenivorans TaxID=2987520 RepID=A0ABT5RV63_9BURK|nr:AraC family transcriptional regulator [Acidovorax benzenivorans]MDD2177587.1 AraC family transcriptional regulator [Acidovorax benzenivorans]